MTKNPFNFKTQAGGFERKFKTQASSFKTIFKTTAEIKVPENLIDQIIGQNEAVEIVKKAAKQRRNVLLIGTPGTGKSLLGQALAKLLGKEKLIDVLSYPNLQDENVPLVKIVPKGKGRDLVAKARILATTSFKNQSTIILIIVLITSIIPYLLWKSGNISDIIYASSMITSIIFIIGLILFLNLGKRMKMNSIVIPKLLLDNSEKNNAPYIEATGAHAGALLGDVLHDPLQCLPSSEKINLPNGKLVKISELVDPFLETEGMLNLNENQKFSILGSSDTNYCYAPAKVTRIFKRYYKGDLIKLKTRRGYELLVTPNHPLANINEEGVVTYVEASKMSTGEKLISPYRLPNYVITKENSSFLRLLGYILADGHLRERSISFKLRREFKIKEITKTIKETGLVPKIYKYHKDTILNIHSASFVRKLLNRGIKKEGIKSIPPFIFDLPIDQIHQFISAYLSLDGYINKQGQFELFSKEMIPDFASLLLKLGVRAKIKYREDPGFGKGKIQQFIIFNHFEFAKVYSTLTSNPIHKQNLKVYLKTTKNTHVTFDDEISISFDYFENIRSKTGLSLAKVHKSYYALNPNIKTNQSLTRLFLKQIVDSFLKVTNGPDLYRLKNLAEGSFALDEILSVEKQYFNGFVYNLTTETGTFLVNNVLTHNSGGLGTPAHERLIPGCIHRANGGVLYIDEIGTLDPHSQQELLTALQEKKYPITGQSERSSGSMVRSEALPTDFILVAAGNYQTIEKMHPALRSRIRGYGYEVYVNDTMPDTPENRFKIAQFVAQEVNKDKKIPHFTKEAIEVIIIEAKKRAGVAGKLTLRLRELGGLVRAAGDLALEQGFKEVLPTHVNKAKFLSRTLEQQIADKYIENKKKYEVIVTEGKLTGRVNGLAVLGSENHFSGIVLPIESEVTPGGKRSEIVATGQLGKIAKEAIKNVSAIILKHFGEDVKEKYDIFTQFLYTASSGVEGDSASIAVATSIISALTKAPVRQDFAMTGSLSVRGDVLAVGGVTQKIEAAIEAGIRNVIIPKTNFQDVMLSKEQLKLIKIHPVSTIEEVLKSALDWKGKENLYKKFTKLI